MIDQNVLAQGSASLQARADALLDARFGPVVTRDFTMLELRDGLPRGEIQRWLRQAAGIDENGSAIYRITARTEEGVLSLLQAFDGEGVGEDYNLPRRNENHAGRTIYVGISLKISGRLREHLQQASKHTYALNLRRWCPREQHSLRVEVQAPADQVQAEMFQDVEDALWDQSRPLFGRRGPR